MKLAFNLLLCHLCTLPAQQAQLTSVEKQRAAVRKQVPSQASQMGFFITSWMDSPGTPPGASPPSISSLATEDCEALPEAMLAKLIQDAGQRENIDRRIIRAVIQRESAGNPCAVSPKGAQGLMQLMPSTQIDLGVSDPFDPQANVSAGVRYLKQMLDRYKGDMALALAAYNAGPQRVEPGGKIPDIPETQTYVMSIMGQLNDEAPAEVK